MIRTQKILVVTGANSGIGKAACFRFAMDGWTVVLACRDLEKAAVVREAIVRDTGNDAVEAMAVDLSSKASIRAFAAAFEATYEKLDVLVHNAAYFNHGEAFRLTDDGMEITFATNVAGPFLLTRLLTGALKCSDDPRVLNAGSNIVKHFFSPKRAINLEHLHGPPEGRRPPSVYERYCESKMALLMLTFLMAERLAADGISVNCIQISGAKMSKETLRRFSLRYRLVAWLQNRFFPTPETVAAAYHEITTSERFRGVTGQYVSDKLEILVPAETENVGLRQQWRQVTGGAHYPAYARDPEVQARIWEACEAFASAESGDRARSAIVPQT